MKTILSPDRSYFAAALKLDEHWLIFLGMSTAVEGSAIFFVTVNVLCIFGCVGFFQGHNLSSFKTTVAFLILHPVEQIVCSK